MNKTIWKQTDSRWAKKPYPTKGSTFGATGCGCVACTHIAMEQDRYKNWTPENLRPYMVKKGYAEPGHGTKWSGITETLKYLGHKTVVRVWDDPMSIAFKELNKGNRIGIILFGSGKAPNGTVWTGSGHYVAFTNYKVENGLHKFYCKDSGGRDHDGWFSYEKSMKGCVAKVWIVERLDAVKPKEETTKTDTTQTKTSKVNTKCIDVSEHQGNIDWQKVKKAGIGSVMIRAGYGKNNRDAKFTRNIEGAIKAGLNIGIYWFGYPLKDAMATNEGNYCLKIIEPYKKHINLPVVYDYEYDSARYYKKQKKKNPTKAQITRWTKLFCEAVEKAGYKAGFYYNYDYKVNHYNMSELKKYVHWYALWGKEKPSCDIWQYSSSGKVSGISTKVDMNIIVNTKLLPAAEAVVAMPKVSHVVELPERGYFQKGDKGDLVVALQKFLRKANKGCEDILPLPEADGDFGDMTERHVKLFQDVHHLAIDGQFGKKCQKTADGLKVTPALQSVNFAVAVARDNSFAYGDGQRAHRCGCYICGTNTGPNKKCKEKKGEPHTITGSDGKKHTYTKTYCCNTFITAAYAHGAKDPTILAICKKGSCCGMKTKDWTKSKKIKVVGQVRSLKFSQLEPGDIIICDKTHHHVYEYTGGDYMVEASGNNWSSKSIRHRTGAKSRFSTYQKDSTAYVLRYTA